MRIGQLAVRAGIGVETIRFYERRGLIPRPPRPREGFRDYPEETLVRILFIRRAKQLGFALREISELLSLRIEPGKNCTSVKQYALSKVEEIDSRVEDLQRVKKVLKSLVRSCDARQSTDECPILDALDSRDWR